MPEQEEFPRWDGPLSHPFYSKVVKRCIDFLLALILLIPGVVLMLPLAIWVKLDSPGPVLYRAIRGGYHNQPFYILKFRSMVVDADKTGGCTAKNDSRVTGAGRVMRRFKLDELPQLFNILKGDMSFVGPRPELLLYTRQYTKDQEIRFARTLLSDPAILVLDEATSSIDVQTEQALQKGLNAMLQGRTSFIIAHRLSTIRHCDKIMYIDNGGIVECGSHEELMARRGAYYRLYTAQLDEVIHRRKAG